ncbi:ATP-binding protein [Tersicoccus solisilvae]|uniref:ATP-binding protein n=1 Tax=Tersicoccus solisilvae TaxID=1882339 RepID=A0ABQ1PIA2_9MICC|nr:AAA family ATPase [Tersicoccus solisilvae]GGC97784.1 ATP-binding protein [Tersicoccus solisilvae]
MTSQFIITKEHRRFAEFADAVRKQNTIGVCFGPAGVGKTLSARRYAHWDSIGPFIARWAARSEDDTKIYAAAHRARTVFYTPEVSATMRALQDDLRHGPNPSLLELIIIDESERLTGNAVEWLRDQYDRTGIAMILIGMPGIEKQFSHYPQLYSRLGFAHQYRPLGHDELLFVLERQWRKLGKTLDPDDFTDAQAIAAVERITRGNFRLPERLLPQIQRVLKINELDVITNDVVEAARSTLVIGTT